jgi:hypothetical protein
MSIARAFPRWSLALSSGLVAVVSGWAAAVLPWRDWTVFSAVTAVVALSHASTAVLAVLGHSTRRHAWRLQAVVALTYLAYLTWNLLTSAVYIAELYGGLGKGVAVSLGLVWTIVAFFTVPLSAWGIAVTGGVRPTRAGKAGAAVLVLLAVFGLMRVRQAAAAESSVSAHESSRVREIVQGALVPLADLRVVRDEAPSLMIDEPATCPDAPSPGRATIVATFLVPGVADRPEPTTRCVQAETLEQAAAALRGMLEAEAFAARIKIDVVTGVKALRPVVPVVDSMLLRPGLDGVCEGERCLMPWQLVALDQFNLNTPIPVIPELRFGFDAARLRAVLEGATRSAPPSAALEGLVRIETASFVTDGEGKLHGLRRMRRTDTSLDAPSLARALEGAENYITAALGQDGRFEYNLDPFTGRPSYRGFSLARQAGTTLVVCELAADRRRAKKVATAALRMLASTQRKHGEMSALHYPSDAKVRRIPLGNTALSAIAFLSCRELVGSRFDEDIAAMTRFLLHMQRPDGSFHPLVDMESGEPIPGPDPLYAVGQAVFALSLLEELTADPSIEGLPEHGEVRESVERAMNYIARDYWNHFASDFFFMEENWHCLAARASLGHHRNEAYEQFCLDYVEYKKRLILDETSGVSEDLVGGYGFGNVLLPHNTGSSGFGEALAAAMAIRRAREAPLDEDALFMRRALGFLLRHQWDDVSCFACSAQRPVQGAFGEHMASPIIRIDYVQHAMAAMGHGGRMLDLVDGG